MKKLILLFGICLIALVSCDGRKSFDKSLTNNTSNFEGIEPYEIIVFKPESPFYKKVDTLLHNGYRVKINTYTDSDNSIVTSKIKDTITTKTHHRSYKFDIQVEKKGNIIYSDSFNKTKANALFSFRDDFQKKAVLQYISLSDEPTLDDKIRIDFTYIIPETERYADQTLFILDNGSVNVIDKTINE